MLRISFWPEIRWYLEYFEIFFRAETDKSIREELEKSYGTIYHNGLVNWWPAPLVVQTNCPIDVLYFPFDQQKCYLQFSAWAYNSKEVCCGMIMVSKPKLDFFSAKSNNGGWHWVGKLYQIYWMESYWSWVDCSLQYLGDGRSLLIRVFWFHDAEKASELRDEHDCAMCHAVPDYDVSPVSPIYCRFSSRTQSS